MSTDGPTVCPVTKIRLYGQIEKVEEQSDGTLVVHGIASTESRDADGEIVRASAMRAALPDYLKFGAIREMHQPMAAGTALGAEVGVDGVTRLQAHVVDPVACLKVKTGTYKGFSIGGRVLPSGRNKSDPKVIEIISLTEISLVDRPANPDAVFQLVKLEQEEPEMMTVTEAPVQGEYTATVPAQVTEAPVQVQAEPVEKAGRRFSGATKAMLKAAHEAVRVCEKALSDLGYDAEEEEPEGDEGKDPAVKPDGDGDEQQVKMADQPKGEDAVLKAHNAQVAAESLLSKAEGLLKALTVERDALAKKLKDAESRLAVKGALRAMPVEKAQDAGVPEVVEPEPKTALDEIRKSHRNPIRVLSRG